MRVKHDNVEWIGNESHLTVKKDVFEKLEADHHFELTGDDNAKIGGTVSPLDDTLRGRCAKLLDLYDEVDQKKAIRRIFDAKKTMKGPYVVNSPDPTCTVERGSLSLV